MTPAPPTLDDLAVLRSAMTDAERERWDFLMGWQPPIPWQDWLARYFPDIIHFAPRHVRLWEWFRALTPGVKPRSQIEVWPRGGGKSSSCELACANLAQNVTRRFCLYLCGTQDQADLHIQSIASLMEQIGVAHQVNRFGRATGWRRDQLRTATGFNVAGYGLDTALRGIKIDQYRPDLIILDDIDSDDDTQNTVDSKLRAIRNAILPSGSTDCAVLYVQTLTHDNGVMASFVNGTADFLLDRNPVTVSPAVEGLEIQPREDGTWRIVSGIPTWEGQSLAICESQINTWGYDAFLREAQHECKDGAKYPVFDVDYLEGLEAQEPVEVVTDGRNGISGTLEVFEAPLDGVTYIIGADVAEGLRKKKSDESTADVIRMDTGRQVASYYGKPDPKAFASDLLNLSCDYNKALINPENNSVGLVVVSYLEDGGANLWYNSPAGKVDEEPDQDQKAGTRTTARSKGMIDSELRSAIVDAAHGRESIGIVSQRCIDQLKHYVHLEAGGRGGEGQWHDDHVRSLGLAWYVAKDYVGSNIPDPEPDPDWRPAYAAQWSR